MELVLQVGADESCDTRPRMFSATAYGCSLPRRKDQWNTTKDIQ